VPFPSTRERLERLEETLQIARQMSQYADACNLFIYGGLDVIRHKLDVLRGHCGNVGRDYEEIERTALSIANLAEDGMTAEDVLEPPS
jgi:hypothetical protein